MYEPRFSTKFQVFTIKKKTPGTTKREPQRYRVTLPLKDNGGTKHVIILQLLSNNNSIHDCEL
jgi:hypothetical protein